ncbi:MAG TPA: TIGR00282 family metallophosphoesterase [Terriglobia bacterium]|jgi:metallophosphoesterase (TIGR00282 family)|nr:TIGR00282 family metallophosphoesterase [Terriglobia bacterium]
MKILFIGDIFGSPGRRALHDLLGGIVAAHAPDLILANGENAAAGFGITPALVNELLAAGIDVLTSGNHIWDRKEIFPYLAEHAGGRLLRPANFPAGAPGQGLYLGRTRASVPYAVLNLQGRVFMQSIDCPFRGADALLEQIPAEVKIRILDMHAETTSEKMALGWYLDGRLTAVLGTHTHIATADERVLPAGTAYITDVGMTGPYDSVIGIEKRVVIEKFLNQLPARFEVAKEDVRLCGVLIEADPADGRALSIQRITLPASSA